MFRWFLGKAPFLPRLSRKHKLQAVKQRWRATQNLEADWLKDVIYQNIYIILIILHPYCKYVRFSIYDFSYFRMSTQTLDISLIGAASSRTPVDFSERITFAKFFFCFFRRFGDSFCLEAEDDLATWPIFQTVTHRFTWSFWKHVYGSWICSTSNLELT